MSPSASKGLGLWDVCETWTKKRTWSSSWHNFAELSWRSCHACWWNVGWGHRMLPSASDWLSGWSIGLEWEVCWWENVKTWKDSLNFRKTGEAALWVCWRGGSNYDGVGMYLLLLPLSSVCHYACLPHPSTVRGVLERFWAASWKEAACFNRYSNLIVSWNQNLLSLYSLKYLKSFDH